MLIYLRRWISSARDHQQSTISHIVRNENFSLVQFLVKMQLLVLAHNSCSPPFYKCSLRTMLMEILMQKEDLHGLLCNFSVHANVACRVFCSFPGLCTLQLGNSHSATLFPHTNVQCTQMYIAHKCTLHTNVYCTQMYIAHKCTLHRLDSYPLRAAGQTKLRRVNPKS